MKSNTSSLLLFSLIIYLSALTHLDAQAPDSVWLKTFDAGSWEKGFDIVETYDHGFIILGIKHPLYDDIWIIKTNSNGDTLWSRTFAGKWNEYPRKIIQTADSGFVIIGQTDSFGEGLNDLYLIKTDKMGIKKWDKTFGGLADDNGISLKCTPDGGYILVGGTYSFGNTNNGRSDLWLIKTDKNGDSLWSKTFGDTLDDQGFDVDCVSSGGYIITGLRDGDSNKGDVWILKVDDDGHEQWSRTFGGLKLDLGKVIHETKDNGFIICGETSSYAPEFSALIIKTDSLGNELWIKTFGLTGYNIAESVSETIDNSYVITGYTEYFGSGGDVLFAVLDTAGATKMFTTIGGQQQDWGYKVINSYDNGYAIIGHTLSYASKNSDILLIKITDTTPPPAPQNLTGTFIDSSFVLSWFSLNTSDWSHYIVYRRTNHTDYQIIGETTALSYTDSTLLADNIYYYVVKSIDLAGNQSDNSNEIMIDLNLPPAAPQNLKAFLNDAVEVELSWSAVAEEDIDYYRIFRRSKEANTLLGTTTDTSFIDTTVAMGITYYYTLSVVDQGGKESDLSNSVQVEIPALPQKNYLSQNYPNPFYDLTTITYGLAKPAKIKITIFDILGNEIIKLIHNYQEAGHTFVTWDGKDQFGNKISSGIYFCSFSCRGFKAVIKIIHIK